MRFNQPVCEPPVDAEHGVYVYVHAHSICYIRFIAAFVSATRVSASSSLGYVLKVCNLRKCTTERSAGDHEPEKRPPGCVH